MSDPVSPETAERADATKEELRRELREARAELARVADACWRAQVELREARAELAKVADACWRSQGELREARAELERLRATWEVFEGHERDGVWLSPADADAIAEALDEAHHRLSAAGGLTDVTMAQALARLRAARERAS